MSNMRSLSDLFDAQGFLVDPELWDRDLALRIAAQLDLEDFEESHWAVIDHLREHYLFEESPPSEEDLCQELDLVTDCVQSLFGSVKNAWKVAGLPDPE